MPATTQGAATIVQAAARGMLERIEMAVRYEAASVLQAATRGRRARRQPAGHAALRPAEVTAHVTADEAPVWWRREVSVATWEAHTPFGAARVVAPPFAASPAVPRTAAAAASSIAAEMSAPRSSAKAIASRAIAEADSALAALAVLSASKHATLVAAPITASASAQSPQPSPPRHPSRDERSSPKSERPLRSGDDPKSAVTESKSERPTPKPEVAETRLSGDMT